MPGYQSSEDKAMDNRSSAYTLLAVGGIGFAAVLLVFLGVIPLYQNAGITRYLVCGVMGALFILFIVFGFVSMRDSKVLLVKAKSENSLFSELTRWCGENLDGAAIDAMIDAEFLDEGTAAGLTGEETPLRLTEEERCLRRIERMRALIDDKFMNLDDAFVDHFVDEYYQKLYEKSQEP